MHRPQRVVALCITAAVMVRSVCAMYVCMQGDGGGEMVHAAKTQVHHSQDPWFVVCLGVWVYSPQSPNIFILAFGAAGHSLGGAVALLCTLRLLQGLPGGTPSLSCICFGTPAIGNAALAALVAEYGWSNHILNFILPGVPLVKVTLCKLDTCPYAF